MSDLNVDSALTFEVWVDDELEKLNTTQGIKSRLNELLMFAFKTGLRCGKRPDNIPIDLSHLQFQRGA